MKANVQDRDRQSHGKSLLARYKLAAVGAVGASALCPGSTQAGTITYTDFAGQVIGGGGTELKQTLDTAYGNLTIAAGPGFANYFTFKTRSGGVGGVVTDGTIGGRDAAALVTNGETISSALTFNSVNGGAYTSFGGFAPGFTENVPNAFVGFETSTGNYGYVAFDWSATLTQASDITVYINSVAGESITAGAVPEPSTLLLASLGAAGVALMRKLTKKKK